MRSFFCRFCVVLALLPSLGLHWVAVQQVAWVKMLFTYSQDASLAEAVAKTFDGEHPCEYCQLVNRGLAAENDSDQGDGGSPTRKKSSEKRLLMALADFPQHLSFNQVSRIDYPAWSRHCEIRADEPAVPPPEQA